MDRLPTLLAASLVLVAVGSASADPPLDDDLEELDTRLAAHPEDIDALVSRSELLVIAGRGQDALVDLRVAASLAPDDRRVVLQRASVLHQMGEDERALAELDASIARWRTADALGMRARILLALDRIDDAIRAYDDALDVGPDVDLFLERGRLLEQAGRLDEAALGYHVGLQATGSIALRLAAIELDLRAGHAARALATIDEAAQDGPRWLLLRARALDGLGRAADARQVRAAALLQIDQRLARRPTIALQVDRGEALLALGRIDEARAAAARALSLSAGYLPARDLDLRVRRAARQAASAPQGGAR